MGLESATYISDLVTTNPAGADDASQGDNHIRLLKTVLQNTFPGASQAIGFERYSSVSSSQSPGDTDGGTNYLMDSSGGDRVVTLPDSGLVTLPNAYTLTITKSSTDTHSISFSPSGTDVVKGGGSLSITYPWQFLTIRYVGSGIWRVVDFSRVGQVDDYLGSVVPPGTILATGSIGNVSSEAGYANADCEALYHLLWRSMADAEAAVAGGRGVSAAADWAANKALTIPDFQGRAGFGKDDMSGTTAGRITSAGSGIDGTVLGKTGGAETHTLTEAELAAHTHTVTDPGHIHDYDSPSFIIDDNTEAGDQGQWLNNTYITKQTASAETGISLANTGSGDAHNNLPPAVIVNKIIYLG